MSSKWAVDKFSSSLKLKRSRIDISRFAGGGRLDASEY